MALRKVLTTPSKIASALDWKAVSGSRILSLDIHKDRIGMAVASHPSFGNEVSTLNALPITNKRGEVDQATLNELSSIVRDHKVCGMVVSWPVQEETGKMGAACGRVLHTLEDLLKTQQQAADSSSTSSSPVVTPNRPLCLWNHSHVPAETQDEWGRNSGYAKRSSEKKRELHIASKEQYYQDENVAAVQVWDDFCRAHWPALYEQNQRTASTIPSRSTATSSEIDSLHDDTWSQEASWEDSSAYMTAS